MRTTTTNKIMKKSILLSGLNLLSIIIYLLLLGIQQLSYVSAGLFMDNYPTYDFYSQSDEQELPQYTMTEEPFQFYDHMAEPKNRTELTDAIKVWMNNYFHLEYAMNMVNRRDFTLDTPYHIKSVDVGFNSRLDSPITIAQIVSLCMDHLQYPNTSKTEYPLSYQNKKILDIGSGVGYLSAVFGHIVSHTGHVIAIEHVPEIVKLAKMAYAYDHWHFLLSERVKFIVKDGRKGHAEEGPYDIIHVGAACLECPKEIIEQLKPGGRLIYHKGIHLGPQQMLTVIDKAPNGTFLPEEMKYSIDHVTEGLMSLKEQMDEYKLRLSGKYRKLYRIDLPPHPPPDISGESDIMKMRVRPPINYTGYTHDLANSAELFAPEHERSDMAR